MWDLCSDGAGNGNGNGDGVGDEDREEDRDGIEDRDGASHAEPVSQGAGGGHRQSEEAQMPA